MNDYNRLLSVLDALFGFEDKKRSTFRKVGQHYDERTNEYVILIEYRVRRGTNADRETAKRQSDPYVGKLLRHLNRRASLR